MSLNHQGSVGLTRLEGVIFFAITILILCLAIPQVKSSRLRANHTLVGNNLLTIAAANSLYFEKYRQYAPRLMDLYPDQFLMSQSLLKASDFNQPEPYEGYYYVYNIRPPHQTFLLFAVPVQYSTSGVFTYVINELEQIYQRDIHQGREWTLGDIQERFLNFDYFGASYSSPWVTRGNHLTLRSFDSEVWDKGDFAREENKEKKGS